MGDDPQEQQPQEVSGEYQTALAALKAVREYDDLWQLKLDLDEMVETFGEDEEETEDKDWWEVSYRIINPDTSLHAEGSVEVIADDADSARHYAGLSNEARTVLGTRREFVIGAVRKI